MKRALVCLVALSAALAHAEYHYLSFKMIADAAHPFPVYVDARSQTPAGLQYAVMENAANAAWNTWNAVSCASVKTTAVGASTGIPNVQSTLDTFSVSPIWMLNASDPDFQEIFGQSSTLVPAISLVRAYNGVLETCDSYFNAIGFSWSTDTNLAATEFDVQSIVLHEAGHCLGLNHQDDVAAVMDSTVVGGRIRRVLNQTDVGAICARYPVDGTVGSPCLAGDTCASADLKCLTQPNTGGLTQKLCSRGCGLGTNTNCELPTTCQPSSAFSGFNGACLMPGNQVNHVGAACGDATTCGSGNAICKPPQPATNGNSFWVDGYCTQNCATGDPMCPAGSTCTALNEGPQCTQNCRIGLADCRPEYACAPIDEIETQGVCIPRCYANSDCADPSTQTCRTCDGLCVNNQNPVGQIGDVCLDSSTCGAGQVCRVTSRSLTQKQCTQQCSRGCAVCPSGTTCTATDTGELLCLRQCTGHGTCPLGLRCEDTASGKVCLPKCQSNSDCKVGDTCLSGECYPPEGADAGCMSSICMKPDAGRPINPTPRDAGTGNGGSGGCGCTTSDPAALWLLLSSLVFTRRKERR